MILLALVIAAVVVLIVLLVGAGLTQAAKDRDLVQLRLRLGEYERYRADVHALAIQALTLPTPAQRFLDLEERLDYELRWLERQEQEAKQ